MVKKVKEMFSSSLSSSENKERKYKFNWYLKFILCFTFPLWFIPFLICNLFFGLMLRNMMQNFKRTGFISNTNFKNIALNSLEFYNRDMILQQVPQLVITRNMWEKMYWQDIVITTADNCQLAAFLIINKQSQSNQKWVIASHGWKQNRYSILYLVKHFYEQGYNVITYDMRGQGANNSNDSITFGIKEANDLWDILQFLNNYVKTNYNSGEVPKITLIGNSMGGNVVLETICRFDTAALGVKSAIVDCAFDTFSNMIKEMGHQKFKVHWFWFYYGVKLWFCCLDKFSITKIASINKLQHCAKMPVLFIHGLEDEIAPVTMTEKLYHRKILYENPKLSTLLIVPNAKHIRAITTDYNTYCQKTLDFVRQFN